MSYELEYIKNYTEDRRFSRFEQTASLGRLHIDEAHGIIAITLSDKLKKSEKPAFFFILDIDECSLHPINAKATNRKVSCDAEFSMHFTGADIYIKQTVKSGIKCEFHRVDSSHVEWEEPAALSFMRNIINQTYRTAIERYNDDLRYKNPKHDIDVMRAKALYMLDEPFTVKELKSRRNTLTKAFHPDVSGEDTNDCARKVIESYNILLPLARKD